MSDLCNIFHEGELAHCKNASCKWSGLAVDTIDVDVDLLCPKCGETAYYGNPYEKNND